MQLPIWMPGLGHVNMYGLVDDHGLTVIDPGLPGPQSWKALKQRLKTAGYKLKDIHTVVVTHSHPDHFGGAGRIARETGAELITHHAFSTFTVKGPSPHRALTEGEAKRAEVEAAALAQSLDVEPDELPTINDDPDLVHDDTEERESTSSPWGATTPWGTTNQGPPLRRKMMFRAMRLLFTPPEPTQRVHHGARIRMGGRDWFAVHTPGHTVDHICAWDPESGVLLTGDHVLPSITPHVSGVRHADSLKSYLATLDLVASLDGVKLGLPAHGHPFTDVPGRARAIQEHHAERMEMLRDAGLALGAATVPDLSHEVFPKRHWGTMAESETFAHLEHMVNVGMAERWEEDGMLHYRVGGSIVIADDDTIRKESSDLLAHLIRNACVNDGTPESGFESRSTDVLAQYLGDSGLDLERYTAQPGRENLVARIEGSDPSAPTLLLMGHTDVVPVNPDGWQRDPFAGEIIDDEVWGRGAVDMLNLTATMAVAFRDLARSGFKPRGTLVYLAVADEENLGTWGAEHLVENERDAVMADYVVTEAGGFQMPSAQGPRLPVIVGEKGSYWCRITVRGTPGHASQPFRTDNALVTAAEIVRRLAEFRPPTHIHDTWRRFIEGVDFGPEWNAALLDEDGLTDFCQTLPIGLARQAHACTHTTFAPTIIHGGTKTNVIPDRIDVDVDIRTLPGQRSEDVRKLLDDALGDLAAHVEVNPYDENESTASPADSPMWDAMDRVSKRLVQGSSLVPFLTVGATDARFFRRKGAVAYGYGLFSRKLSFDDYANMFHGNDERVDTESLVLSTQLWDGLARDLLG